MNIEFGAGETPAYPDYKKCDVRDLDGIDYVCNAWEIDQHVEPDSVEHIFSRHFFEHLTFEQGRVFVSACLKILKEGGCHEIILPNMRWHVRQWLTEDNVMGFNIEDPFQRGMDGLWGKQRGDVEQLWDVHKSGYKDWQLVELFRDAGYTNLEFVESSVKELHIKAYK